MVWQEASDGRALATAQVTNLKEFQIVSGRAMQIACTRALKLELGPTEVMPQIPHQRPLQSRRPVQQVSTSDAFFR